MLRKRGVDATATPGRSGQFDILRDGELLFSKHAEHRFPGEAEVVSLVGG